MGSPEALRQGRDRSRAKKIFRLGSLRNLCLGCNECLNSARVKSNPEAIREPSAGAKFSAYFRAMFPSFGTFEYAYPLTDGVRAFMPPQGLLVIAAVLPKTWKVRFIDENMSRASADDFAWADAVFVSGMHIQRRRMEDICERAHAFGKVAVLGGPSVSACPELYPAFDYLHIGELGDATDALIGMLARDVSRPREQIVLKTKLRRDLCDFPAPAYELAEIGRYFLGSIQFSSGCPYTCEFCDIPGLYGRVPRLKTPAQVIGELDKLLACGVNGSIYFVDDNFIANRRALRDLLPHLIQWQKRNGYAVSLSCEATLNIARSPEILSLMREAAFDTIFCGIETPEPEALTAIDKRHNMIIPILDAVRAINRHGMEVVSGIILGLDTDTRESGAGILEFLEQSKIPMATINLLQALPRTPLWDRLQQENRLLGRGGFGRANRMWTSSCPTTKCSPCGKAAWPPPTSPKHCSPATNIRCVKQGPIA